MHPHILHCGCMFSTCFLFIFKDAGWSFRWKNAPSNKTRALMENMSVGI